MTTPCGISVSMDPESETKLFIFTKKIRFFKELTQRA